MKKSVVYISILFITIFLITPSLNAYHLEISNEKGNNENKNSLNYKLLIISPNSFKITLKKLVDHKNEYDFTSKLVTLNEIYNDKYFDIKGRDEAEEIKYFLFNANKNWNVSYVLLVGNINKLPIRKTWLSSDNSLKNPITDMYYSDICFSDGSFCSWDSNNNGYYGEKNYNGKTDTVDLYPDLYVGRLPCNNIFEVKIVVDKIIEYEKNSYGKDWGDNIVLAGGDTHPSYNDFYEGEFLIDKIKDATPNLDHIMLKTSDGTYSKESLNNEINKGAGFVCYAGHGFETGLGTHPPNSQEWINYHLYDLFNLKNRNKLPIVFFSACLTARLDYNIYNLVADILYSLSDEPKLDKPEIDFPVLFPCFAWSMVAKPNGGAIATIGATRIAYSMISESGVHGGCCYIALKFFENLDNSEYLGQMLVSAKTDYITNSLWDDKLTLEEFILLGDPSLKIGGYN